MTENINEKKNIWLSNWMFPILVGLLAAGITGGTSMYMNYGTGSLSTIAVLQMFKAGLTTGDFAAAAAFAAGFLIARVLEGPLVGILDVGGSLMTGVGVGIPSVMIMAGYGNFISNFYLAIPFGFGVGALMGGVIILIRKVMPEDGFSASGTDIMMGAGNAIGRFLGPLIILSAVKYNVPVGLGAVAGAALFIKLDKSIVGGSILGAMLVGAIKMYM